MVEYFCDETKKELMEDIQKISFFREEKLECIKVERGIVLPPYSDDMLVNSVTRLEKPTFGWGGIVSENHGFINDSQMCAEPLIREGMICKKRFGGEYRFDDSQVERYVDEDVIYAGFFWKQWGHFLIDIIGRLWYALENTDKKIVFIVDKASNTKISGNYLELINLMGIDSKRIVLIDSMTQFKSIYVPETSFYPGKYFTLEYMDIINRIKESVAKSTARKTEFSKIYFSRSHFSSNEVGEKNLERIMECNGFKVLHPEKLSTTEQINYIINAKTIASVSGSVAHNALFANRESEWYVFERDSEINPYQIQINRMVGMKMVFIDAYWAKNKNTRVRKPYFLYCNNEVKSFVKSRGFKVDIFQTEMLFIKEFILYSLKVVKRSILGK